jgi:hypothetical protein
MHEVEEEAIFHTWTDQETNAEIVKELNTTPVLDKIRDYKRNWTQHVNLMSRNRLPRLIKTTSKRQKEPRRPRKTSGYVRPERVRVRD